MWVASPHRGSASTTVGIAVTLPIWIAALGGSQQPEAHPQSRAPSLAFVKDERWRAHRGAAAPGAVLDQVQGRSRWAGMDLRARVVGPGWPGGRADSIAGEEFRHQGLQQFYEWGLGFDDEPRDVAGREP